MISENAMLYAETFSTMAGLTEAVRYNQKCIADSTPETPVHVIRQYAENIVACHTYGHALRGLCEWRGQML